jgi:glucose-6-phosphate dehydrogenase assembly protein OpcA
MEADMTVDVAAVERELDRIQRELTNSEVRTSLFNLVIFCPTAEHSTRNEALTYLLGKRAARVIHVVDSEQPHSGLDVSARCFIDAEHKAVCFEEMVITNGADGAGSAAGTWVPLLVRDIPTFVLWLHRLTSHADLLLQAREQADKLLVDSELSVVLGDDAGEAMATLRDLVVSGPVPATDFAFRRLLPLQRLLAFAFDDPVRTPLLEEISQIEIRGLPAVGGRYLALWLADRLSWNTRGRSFADRRGRPVGVSSHASSKHESSAVKVAFHNASSITVGTRDGGCADVNCGDGETLHPVSEPLSDGELLLGEVDVTVADSLLRGALTMLPS